MDHAKIYTADLDPRYCNATGAKRARVVVPSRHGRPPVHAACSLAIFGSIGAVVAVHMAHSFSGVDVAGVTFFVSATRPYPVLYVAAAAFVNLAVRIFSILGGAGAAFAVFPRRAPLPSSLRPPFSYHCCCRVLSYRCGGRRWAVTHCLVRN